MLIDVEYPGGERVLATGHHGRPLTVQIVPHGPEAALGDILEVDFTREPPRVVRIVGGPRRPTIHVRLDPLSQAKRDRWMDARDDEGWSTRDDPDDPALILIVATRDDQDPEQLHSTITAPRP